MTDARDFFEGLEAQRRGLTDLYDKYVPMYESREKDFYKGRERAVWRCKRRGCLLLHVWDAPEGTVWYRPAYKLSPGLNLENSNAAGRANNTLDGDRRWKANLAPFDHVRMFDPNGGISLECDHVHHYLTARKMIWAVDSATRGKPTRVMI